jgi:hypothetical protein
MVVAVVVMMMMTMKSALGVGLGSWCRHRHVRIHSFPFFLETKAFSSEMKGDGQETQDPNSTGNKDGQTFACALVGEDFLAGIVAVSPISAVT